MKITTTVINNNDDNNKVFYKLQIIRFKPQLFRYVTVTTKLLHKTKASQCIQLL